MVCKNTGMYGFLGTSWVLITMAPHISDLATRRYTKVHLDFCLRFSTRRYTKVHVDFCLRFSTLIGQIGRVPLFGAGPRRYIRSRLCRLAVTVFWRALTASWRQKGKRKQVFPRAIRTTELPSNPSPLTFGINRSKSYRPLRRTQPWQPTSLSKLPSHAARGCHTHTRTYNARQKGTKALTVPRCPPVRAAR